MKLLSRLGGFHRLAIHVLVLLACFAFLAPRADAQIPEQNVWDPVVDLNPHLGTLVNIPDANLRAIVAESVPKAMIFNIGTNPPKAITVPTARTVTTVTMAALTSLDASEAALTSLAASLAATGRSPKGFDASKPITDLTGLEHATGLVSLNLNGNNISNLSALSSLTNLKFLDMSSSQIQSPGALASLVQLQLLNLSDNSITSIGNLSKLTNLVRLDLSDNGLTDLTGIEGMTKLTHLYLGNNNVTRAGVAPLRTLLEKDNVDVHTDMLVVKDVRFLSEPATSYGAGDTVRVAVRFFNRGVRHTSTAELKRVPSVNNGVYTDDPTHEYYTGDKPYVALTDSSKLYLFRADWEWDDALQPRNTTVQFEYSVQQRASADAISIDSLHVPADTRITHDYELMARRPEGQETFETIFPLQLDVPDSDRIDVVGIHETVDLPESLPTGRQIDASGPLFPLRTRTASISESLTTSGDVLTLDAVDPNSGTITYTVFGGADKDAFTIPLNPASDRDKLRLVNMLDYDNPTDLFSQLTDAEGNPTSTNAAGNNQYVVVVKAESGTRTPRESDLQRIIVTVTDVGAPGQPDEPTVTGPTASPQVLNVSWTAPTNPGGSPITNYNVQYREGTTGNFTDAGYDGIATSTTISGLTPGTSYQVQVRAKNAEGTGGWSNSATGTTAANQGPSFSISDEWDVQENQWEILDFEASDSDDAITGYSLRPANTADADKDWFEIEGVTLGIKNPDFENPGDELISGADDTDKEDPGASGNNVYVVFITVKSGTGNRERSAEQRFEITVTNVAESPPKPTDLGTSGRSDAPDLLVVTWSAGVLPLDADKTPPPVIRYEVQYRGPETGGWSGANVKYPDNRTETGAEISGLTAGGTYDVRVQAINDEGELLGEQQSGWRTITGAQTANNAAPTFTTSQTTFSVTENTPITTPVTTIAATDADAMAANDEDKRDTVITYTLGETADHAAFEIGADTGVLRFKNVPDFENPADTAVEEMEDPSHNSPAGDNVYIVAVTATSGDNRARLLDATLWLTITVVDVNEFDDTPPVVQQLAFASPPSGGYTLGSKILVEVTFDDDGVDIPAGVAQDERPFVTLYLGEATAANRRRAYWQGRRDGNSTIVTFAYEVQADDFATTITIDEELGITVPPDVPIRNSAGVAAETTSVRDGGDAARGQEQVRIEFPDVAPQRGGGPQPGRHRKRHRP